MSRKRWTDDKDAVLIAMFHDGKPDHEIAPAIGRSAAAVKTRRILLGLLRCGPASRGGKVGAKRDTQRPGERDTSAEEKRRTCLMCGGGFASRHFGERVCPSCKASPVWKSGVA